MRKLVYERLSWPRNVKSGPGLVNLVEEPLYSYIWITRASYVHLLISSSAAQLSLFELLYLAPVISVSFLVDISGLFYSAVIGK
jgi:hypothetical protein